ncbi:response regulator receiver domain-containing protein [Pseudorhodoferax soli]|uniref:Response regulator receiver domain-containing protein n=2 Tax=Pseudorhodoferax soli TaxID=545864 RepID=A0A368XFD5_9BURK|nr:response regulator receiver domain-containing protein [Pseudorhodoferax soli]
MHSHSAFAYKGGPSRSLASSEASLPNDSGLSPMPQRVFLVEDNPLIRQTMTEMLEDVAGACVVAWADSEQPAIAQMRREPWDVALVDLFLREGSGLGVARAFMQRAAHQRLYVVTNYATPDIRERCMRQRVDGVFDKSTELDRLLAALEHGDSA